MTSGSAGGLALAFLGLYPIVTSAIWIAGGLLYRLFDGSSRDTTPAAGWPGVTILIPAYNEAAVIAACVRAAQSADYPDLEILVLDDGSTDDTAGAATLAAAGDGRIEVVRDPVNRGKSDRLNLGFLRARHDLVLVTDADTHVHPLAIRLLVARLVGSERTAAVAGAPHVTNRRNLLCAMQIIEAASIIGLIRRTQALMGRVCVVAGVLALFRRDAVLAVGGYRGQMATEDIDLSWRLLLAGWRTSYEPHALVGMEVPSGVRPLWAQRRRWARGQGEVLHVHLRELVRWRHRGLWALAGEGIASLAWVVLLAVVWALVAVAVLLTGADLPNADERSLVFAWGIAVAVVATIQLSFALSLDFPRDRRAAFGVLLGPVYPIAYWLLTACAALRAQVPAIARGPAKSHVTWDIARDRTSGA